MIAGSEGLGKIILHPVFIVNVAECQRGKADDGVHGGAAFGAVGSLGRCNGIRKRLIHLPVGGAVGQDKDILGPALYLAAHGDVMEPAPLFGLPMIKLEIPFALLPAEQSFQKVLVAIRVILRVQRCQSTGILPHFFPRDAQQPFDVGADIIHL